MKDILTWILLLVSTLLAHAFILSKTPFLFFKDMMVYPWLVDQGLMVYKDIALMYMPGIVFILLPYFRIFGFSIASLATFDLILIFLTDILLVYACYKIFRSLAITICVVGFYLLWQPLMDGKLLWFETALTPLLLLAFLEEVLYVRTKKNAHLVLSGVCIAFALFIKQNTVWAALITTPYVLYRVSGLSKWSLRSLLYITTPTAVILVILVVMLLTTHVLKDFLFWALWVPLVYLQRYTLLPTESEIRLLLPLFLLVTISIIFTIRSHTTKPWRTIVHLTTLWLVGAVLFAYPRFGLFHLQVALPFVALHFGYLIICILREKRRYIQICMLCGMSVIFFLTYQQVKYFWMIKNPSIETRTDADEARLADAIERRIGKAQFFSLEYTELLYFTLRRGPYVLPWMSIGPWLNQLPDFDKKLITGIEEKNIPYIISVPFRRTANAADQSLSNNFRSYIFTYYRLSALLSDTILEVYERK